MSVNLNEYELLAWPSVVGRYTLVSSSLVPFLPQFLFISLSIFFVRLFRARKFPPSLNSCLSHCQFLSSARFELVSSLPPSIVVYLIVNFYRPLVSCSLVPFLTQFLFISLLIFIVRSVSFKFHFVFAT